MSWTTLGLITHKNAANGLTERQRTYCPLVCFVHFWQNLLPTGTFSAPAASRELCITWPGCQTRYLCTWECNMVVWQFGWFLWCVGFDISGDVDIGYSKRRPAFSNQWPFYQWTRRFFARFRPTLWNRNRLPDYLRNHSLSVCSRISNFLIWFPFYRPSWQF